MWQSCSHRQQERNMSLCCGGSLGNLTLSSGKRAMIAADAARTLTIGLPDELITACPLCKKDLRPGYRNES
jgi:Fe-S oxidoreductase